MNVHHDINERVAMARDSGFRAAALQFYMQVRNKLQLTARQEMLLTDEYRNFCLDVEKIEQARIIASRPKERVYG